MIIWLIDLVSFDRFHRPNLIKGAPLSSMATMWKRLFVSFMAFCGTDGAHRRCGICSDFHWNRGEWRANWKRRRETKCYALKLIKCHKWIDVSDGGKTKI